MTRPVERIRRLEDVRPGDLFMGPIGGLAGVAVRLGQLAVDGGWRVGPLDVRHIGIVVEASKTYGPGIQNRITREYVEFSSGQSVKQEWPERWTTYPTGLITSPRMVQAMPSGANEISLTIEHHWTPRTAFARIPEDYRGQGADVALVARRMVGTPYSWTSYAALSAYRLGYDAPRMTDWIGRRRNVPITTSRGTVTGPTLPVEAICSVLADQAWSLTGKRVMVGTAPQAVTPSQLGQRLMFDMDGVIWGFGASDPLGREWPVL